MKISKVQKNFSGKLKNRNFLINSYFPYLKCISYTIRVFRITANLIFFFKFLFESDKIYRKFPLIVKLLKLITGIDKNFWKRLFKLLRVKCVIIGDKRLNNNWQDEILSEEKSLVKAPDVKNNFIKCSLTLFGKSQ